MDHLSILKVLREQAGPAETCGLSEKLINEFLERDPLLGEAIEAAEKAGAEIKQNSPQYLSRSETDLIKELSDGFLNFYRPETVSPYIPIAAKGPWIITLSGAVVYDSGGYGMLGQGQNPDSICAVAAKPQVMANIMTPSFSQRRFIDLIRSRIGYLRPDKRCPYDKFICMNSGSEGMAVAMRISDTHTKRMIDPGGRFEGRTVRIISVEGSFHGRTTRPARVSHSTRNAYQALASFQDVADKFIAIPPNDVRALEEAYEGAISEGHYVEAIVLEPVMGEGNPGMAASRGVLRCCTPTNKKA